MITCPLCGDDDLDRIGFAHHIANYCEEYGLALEEGREHDRALAAARIEMIEKQK